MNWFHPWWPCVSLLCSRRDGDVVVSLLCRQIEVSIQSAWIVHAYKSSVSYFELSTLTGGYTDCEDNKHLHSVLAILVQLRSLLYFSKLKVI